MFLCWSAKGGSGTTVVSAALSLVLSHRRPALLVDLAGDAPAALGMPNPLAPVSPTGWPHPPPTPRHCSGWPCPPPTPCRCSPPARTHRLADGSPRWGAVGRRRSPTLGRGHAVVIDAGTGSPPAELLAAASHTPARHTPLLSRTAACGCRRRATHWRRAGRRTRSGAPRTRRRARPAARPWWPRWSTTRQSPAPSMPACSRLACHARWPTRCEQPHDRPRRRAVTAGWAGTLAARPHRHRTDGQRRHRRVGGARGSRRARRQHPHLHADGRPSSISSPPSAAGSTAPTPPSTHASPTGRACAR
jgi:hypothetical protein